MTRYRTIVADPPWEQPDSGARTTSTNGNWRGKWLGYVSEIPYARMTLAEIKALPVADLAAPDAHLYLWTTNRFLEDVWDVARAWGFKPSTILTWCKAPMGIGLGGAYTITTEFVLFARRGKLAPLTRADSTWWQFRAGQSRATDRVVRPPSAARLGHVGQRSIGARRPRRRGVSAHPSQVCPVPAPVQHETRRVWCALGPRSSCGVVAHAVPGAVPSSPAGTLAVLPHRQSRSTA